MQIWMTQPEQPKYAMEEPVRQQSQYTGAKLTSLAAMRRGGQFRGTIELLGAYGGIVQEVGSGRGQLHAVVVAHEKRKAKSMLQSPYPTDDRRLR